MGESGRGAGVVGSLFALGCAWAAVASPYPLIRVACGLALISLVSALMVIWTASRRTCEWLMWGVLAFMVVAFVSMWVCGERLGGGALNGEIQGTRYFLSSHRTTTEVTRGEYWLVAGLELAVFASWPLGLALGAAMSLRSKERAP